MQVGQAGTEVAEVDSEALVVVEQPVDSVTPAGDLTTDLGMSVKPKPPNQQAVNYNSIAPDVPDKLNEWGAPSPKADSAPANPVDVNSKEDQTNNPNDPHSKPTEQLENPHAGKTFNDWDGATKSEEKTQVLDYEGKMVIDRPAGEPMQVKPAGQVEPAAQVEPANQVAQEASAPEVSEKPAVDDEWSGCPW
ncbi:hypothetical protein MJO28_008514 [Puccinia striiformis f. sp. tritici]|uniref:Uncharacterized protein n=2 Tax=Puccinia striiformis TaxID=27350 RepID=A0A2S4V4X9_9BASI|nr:hypothetical protein MJO28_008514 [Puccinia striiformis f. sp. tritici]KAI7952780.1 hypothetical protein MJO29_008411 [Puccinia striiformis f. sp. tritici]POW04530.1 hypothetical protein PSTT_10309 [Puccinia striiformis]